MYSSAMLSHCAMLKATTALIVLLLVLSWFVLLLLLLGERDIPIVEYFLPGHILDN